MDFEGGEEKRLTPPGRDVFTPATSKTGKAVAVASPDENGYRWVPQEHRDNPITVSITQVKSRHLHSR